MVERDGKEGKRKREKDGAKDYKGEGKKRDGGRRDVERRSSRVCA